MARLYLEEGGREGTTKIDQAADERRCTQIKPFFLSALISVHRRPIFLIAALIPYCEFLHIPVTAFAAAKNSRFRSVAGPQLTGGH